MKNKKLISILLLVALLIFNPCIIYAEEESPTPTESTEPSPSVSPSPSTIDTIKLSSTSLELEVGKSEVLTATVSNSKEVEWTSSDTKIATVSAGKITAVSSGTATITAKISGTEITATCKVTVTSATSNIATLKSLVIKNGSLNQVFKSDVYEYNVTVDTDVTELNFTYELTDSNSGYIATGNNNLKNGSVVKIVVTATDKTTTNTYTLTIVKDASSLDLKSLKINGYALNESFNAETLKYTASIPNEIDTITVEANAKDSAATVKVTGTSNLVVGDNTVTVTVSDKQGNTRKYQIIVTRETKTKVEENPTSIISSQTSSITSSNTTNNKTSSSEDSFLKYFIVSLACFILFLIGGIGIYFYLKTSPKRLKKELKNIEKDKENSSPITEVKSNENNEQLKEIMTDNLAETKEYKINDFNKETENLFDDEDV